jgi:peroxiredoxin
LLVRGSARWGALGALVLLAAFAAAIGWALLRGRAPDCHCFGQLHRARAGWSTLVRNLVLATLAAFVAVAGWTDAGVSATGWLARLSIGAFAAVCVGVLAVTAQTWFSWQLLRQHGRLLARLDAVEARLGGESHRAPRGLAIGSGAPSFALPGVAAGLLTLEDLLSYGRPVMLVFSDPGCGPCSVLLPELSKWQSAHAAQVTIAVISRGSGDAHQAIVAEHGIRHVGLQLDREVAQAYFSPATPSAVLIDRDGRIASRAAAGRTEIVKLIEHGLPRAVDAYGQPGYGTAAPAGIDIDRSSALRPDDPTVAPPASSTRSERSHAPVGYREPHAGS